MTVSKIILVLAMMFAAVTAAPALAVDTVYVMRHLPKAEGQGQDPPLTVAGAAQAEELGQRLAGSGIKAVFITPTRRTQETAGPLLKRLGIAVTLYDSKKPEALTTAVASVGGPVLIVGHSNTVPALVAQFGGDPPPPLADNDYGVVYLVDPSSKQVRLLKLGGATPTATPTPTPTPTP